MYVVNNTDYFISNKYCHGANTRQNNNLHLPQVNLTVFKMGVYYSGVKIFNRLPLRVKEISHYHTKFKSGLKEFLYSYCFCTLEEFFFLTEQQCKLFVGYLRDVIDVILWCWCMLCTC
jgi:hypothetical protein